VAASVAQAVSAGISWVLVGVIRAYQLLISPLLGPTCKYYPSCSSYAIQALRLRGPIVGLWLLASRLARCNPWSLGGVDDVPLPRAAHHARHRCHTPDRPTAQRSRSQNE
jgi:putative membrane protein insertion efficiency factor